MAAKKTRSRRKKKILWIFLSILLLLVLLFTFYPQGAEAFFNGFRDFKPKSKLVLPTDIQKAIVTEAVKELTSGVDNQHTDVVAQVDPQDAQIAESGILADNPLYFFKKTGRRIQEFFTFDPLAKTQLILKHNSWEAIETLSLLQKASKQNNSFAKGLAINSVASEITQVEDKFNQILSLSDKVAKSDKDKAKVINGVAFNYAEKYFRDELILRGLEKEFDDSEVIKIENARSKVLSAFAKILINYHPDPQILSREVAKSVAPETGTNYNVLK